MGLRDLWQTLRNVAPEDAEVFSDASWSGFFSPRTKISGRVNADTALYSSAVAACVMVRAKTFSTLPVHVFTDDATGRKRATSDPLYRLLKDAPNPHMTSTRFWRWASVTRDLTGNAYFRVESVGTRVKAIHPLVGLVKPIVTYDGGYPTVEGYTHRAIDGREYTLTVSEVIHWASEFIAADGVSGRSLVEIARESIGLDIAAEEFFGRVLTNGTHMGTVLTTSETLTQTDLDTLKVMLADGAGVVPAGKTRVFHKGLKPEAVGMSIKDADLTANRRYALERICGIWGIPLSSVQDLTHGTYTNTEQGDLALAKHGIRPVCVDAEQMLNLKLFPKGDRFVKFDLNGLMRGDFVARMTGITTAINGGLFTPNIGLAMEDMEPIEGGDVLRFPLNSIPASFIEEYAKSLVEKAEPADTSEPESDTEDGPDPLEPIAEDISNRIRERYAKDGDTDRTREFAARVMLPLATAYATLGKPFDADAFVKEATNAR